MSSDGVKPGTGVVWGTYPVTGDANAGAVQGALVAYDAAPGADGKLKQLFHSNAGEPGLFAKYSTPVVANGRVYVGTFSNKVVQYGLLTQPAPAIAASTTMHHAQTVDATPPMKPPQAASAAGDGLKDIDAMTFACAKAGLNAAAQEAAGAPSQGAYQFSYFRIIKDGHHAFYEVRFKSNYPDEPELKYCVAIYCQQGWDPKPAQASVARMTDALAAQTNAHESHCGAEPTPARHEAK